MGARRIAVIAAWVGAGLVLLVAGALAAGYAFLNSRAGLDMAARQIERAAGDAGVALKIGAIDGDLLSEFALVRIELSDARGRFATVERAEVRWQPLALTGRVLAIDRIAVTRAALDRAPEPSAASGGGEGSGMPALGFDIRLGDFAVDRLSLAPPVLGEAQELAVTASAELAADGRRAKVTAALRAVGAAQDGARLELDYAAAPARFALKGWVREPGGGPIARLAGLAPGEPLQVEIDGKGPASDWRGRLTATAGGLGTADVALGASVGGPGLAITLDGKADLAQALSVGLRPLAAPAVTLSAALDIGTGRGVAVRHFEAASAALRLSGTGRLGLADGALAGEATVEVLDPEALSPLIAPASLGQASATARLAGTLARPVVEAGLAAERLSAGPVRAAKLSGKARFERPHVDASEANLRATLEGLAVSEPVPAGLLGDRAEISATAMLTDDNAVPSLVASLRSGGAKLDFDGAVTAGGSATGRYEIALDDAGPALRGAGAPLGGALRASGTVAADLNGPSARTTLSGALTELRTSDAALAALLGPRVTFSGAGGTGDGQAIDVTALKVGFSAGDIAGKGRIDLARETVSARLDGHAPRLAVLSPLAGVPLAGSARLAANVTGPLATPGVQASLRAEKLAVSGQPVADARLAIGVRVGAKGFDGTLKMQGRVRERDIAGNAAFALRGQTLALSDVAVGLGKDRLTGRVRIDLARIVMDGELAGSIADLKPVAAFAGLEIAGRVGLRVRFADGGADGQGMSLAVEARDFVHVSGVAVAKLALSARAANVLQSPRLSARLTAGGVRSGDATLESFEATAQGAVSSIAWTARGKGTWRGPVTLDAAGSVVSGDNGPGVTVSRLTAGLAGEQVALRSPARLDLSDGTVALDALSLDVAGGTLEGKGSSTRGALDVTLTVKELPARLAAIAAPSLDVVGVVSGQLALSGAPERPGIIADLSFADLRPANAAADEQARFQGKASLTQKDDGLSLEANVTGAAGTHVALAARTGAGLSLAPFGLTGGRDAALNGRLEARARLDLVDDMIGLGADRLSGRLEANATIGGTVAKPDLQGTATFADIFYEGAATGVVVRNGAAKLEIAGERVRLVSLSAEDGDGGKISGSGAFHLSDPADAGLKLAFAGFHAIRRPEADAAVSGALALRGGLAAPALSGEVTVDRAELRIPERLPENVVVLDVIDVNRPSGGEAGAKSGGEPSAGKALKIALDVAVEVPGRAFVRGRGLNSEWSGKLKITGDTAKPVIDGSLSIVRGTFAFAGKTFKLTSGTVTFLPERPDEPEINAVAEATLTDLVARITLSGSAGAPKLEVGSEPSLPQEEVLARILFGKSTGQLSAIQAAQLASTAATLSGAGGGVGIVDKVRQALGVDVLDIEAGGDDTKGASLKAGKYIRDDVFLSVKQGTEPGSQRVGVEIDVLPNVSVESDIGAAADSNVGVNWKWNY